MANKGIGHVRAAGVNCVKGKRKGFLSLVDRISYRIRDTEIPAWDSGGAATKPLAK